MYTKIGLGLLAAAGLTFGVIGTQIGGASPAPPLCTNAPDAGVSSGNGGASASGDQNGVTNPSAGDNGTGAEGNGNGIGGGNGSGNGSDNGSGGGDNGPVTTPTTGDNGNPSTSATADDRFLDLRGNTDEIDVGNGTATVPENNSHLTGRSRILSHLLRINGHVDTH